MKTRIAYIASKFPAPVDEVWDKLQRLDTLQYIAAPFATFKPINNTGMIWREKTTSRFQLKLFGFISMGTHTIQVIQFDKSSLTIYTKENNKYVPVWNHKIVLRKTNDNMSFYSDEVEIYAGWKTPIVFLWSNLFYRHRQKKWLKLLRLKSLD